MSDLIRRAGSHLAAVTAQPRIVDVRADLVIFGNGRTSVDVVVSGWGRLRVGGLRRWVFGTVRLTLLVPLGVPVEIRISGLSGEDRVWFQIEATHDGIGDMSPPVVAVDLRPNPVPAPPRPVPAPVAAVSARPVCMALRRVSVRVQPTLPFAPRPTACVPELAELRTPRVAARSPHIPRLPR